MPTADPILRPAAGAPTVEASAAWSEGYLAGLEKAAKTADAAAVTQRSIAASYPDGSLGWDKRMLLADRLLELADAIRALAKDPPDAP